MTSEDPTSMGDTLQELPAAPPPGGAGQQPNPFPQTHQEMWVQIFDSEPQRALVRKSITVQQFIAEIFTEFERDQELDRNLGYALFLGGARLDETTIVQDIQASPGAQLSFEYAEAIPSPNVLREEERPTVIGLNYTLSLITRDGKRIDIPNRDFPALLGRPHPTDTRVQRPTVDLSFLAEARTISRPHARITRNPSTGEFSISTIKANRMVILNSKSLPLGEPGLLHNGDTIRLGQAILSVRISPA